MDIQKTAIFKLVKYDLTIASRPDLPIEQKIYRLTNALGTLLNLFEQPTTAPTTQYAPIETSPLAAEIDSMFPKTQPSLQSDQLDTKNGRVEHNLDCAHHWSTFHEQFGKAHYRVVTSGNLHHYSTLWCQKCGALWLSGAILVPAVHQHLLISVKRPSKESVENSQEESAKSQSKELTEDQLHWLDVGGVMALTTVKEFIEGRLVIKRSDFEEY